MFCTNKGEFCFKFMIFIPNKLVSYVNCDLTYIISVHIRKLLELGICKNRKKYIKTPVNQSTS